MKLEIMPVEADPTYILTVHYMIGDADGYTDTTYAFDELTEPLIKLIIILHKIEGYAPKGYWGFVFDNSLEPAVEDGIITEEEYNFINEDSDYWDDFLSEIIRSSYCDDREFLVYEGFDITYRDSHNCIHPVKIIYE